MCSFRKLKVTYWVLLALLATCSNIGNNQQESFRENVRPSARNNCGVRSLCNLLLQKFSFIYINFLLITDRSKAVLLLWIFYVFSVLCLLCLCTRLFICALWSPAGKGLTSWFSFVV